MHSRTLPLLLALVTAFFLSGCGDEHAEDKQEIERLYAGIEIFSNHGRGDEYVASLTAESFAPYERLMDLALDGKPEELRALRPTELAEVLTMRVRGKRAELEKMSGREYVKFAVDSGWWKTPPDYRTQDKLDRFTFNGDIATAELVVDGERLGVRHRFVREDGKWKLDEPDAMRQFDRLFRENAREAGLSLEEFIVLIVEDYSGKEVTESTWKPMSRSRR